jgi:FkbM family methyltransferase
VIAEVLIHSQYQCLSGLSSVRTIVDAGANIGTASIFLLRTYPDATVIALEPEPGNFEILQKNLSYYSPRAIPVRKALWHHPEVLSLARGSFRDGGEWSTQVKSTGDRGADTVEGVTLPDLMAAHKLTTIDILKVDIEGAERFIFREDVSAWLDKVRCIAIELHDRECRELFNRATSHLSGTISRHGEVTLWRRPVSPLFLKGSLE